jgi:hypothetical protein
MSIRLLVRYPEASISVYTSSLLTLFLKAIVYRCHQPIWSLLPRYLSQHGLKVRDTAYMACKMAND